MACRARRAHQSPAVHPPSAPAFSIIILGIRYGVADSSQNRRPAKVEDGVDLFPGPSFFSSLRRGPPTDNATCRGLHHIQPSPLHNSAGRPSFPAISLSVMSSIPFPSVRMRGALRNPSSVPPVNPPLHSSFPSPRAQAPGGGEKGRGWCVDLFSLSLSVDAQILTCERKSSPKGRVDPHPPPPLALPLSPTPGRFGKQPVCVPLCSIVLCCAHRQDAVACLGLVQHR